MGFHEKYMPEPGPLSAGWTRSHHLSTTLMGTESHRFCDIRHVSESCDKLTGSSISRSTLCVRRYLGRPASANGRPCRKRCCVRSRHYCKQPQFLQSCFLGPCCQQLVLNCQWNFGAPAIAGAKYPVKGKLIPSTDKCLPG